jgi:hypothetical protein
MSAAGLGIDSTRAKSEVELGSVGMQRGSRARSCLQPFACLPPDDERAGLPSSQIEWIRHRDAGCLATLANTPLPKCLADASRTRQRFLEGEPEAGDMEESLFRPAAAQLFSVEAIKFAGAGARQTKANASIDKLVKKRLAIRTYATTHRQAQTNHLPSTFAFHCLSRHNAFFRRTLRTAIISARRIRSRRYVACEFAKEYAQTITPSHHYLAGNLSIPSICG